MKEQTKLEDVAENPLLDILGKAEYTKFIENDFLARLDDIVEKGKLDALTARLARGYIQEHGDLPCSVREVDEVVTGRTVRGIGNLLEISWNLPNGKTIAKSFVNTFIDEERYEQAYLSQSFFHILVNYMRENVDPDALKGINVLKPTREKNKVFLSNFFLDGETLHRKIKPENIEDHLTKLAQGFKELSQYAEKYEQDIYEQMRKQGERVPKKGIFKPVEYDIEFFEKVILRIDPGLKKELQENKVLDKNRKIRSRERLDKYLKSNEALRQVLERFNSDIANRIYQEGQVISHRDVQFNNIIIDENENYNIIDFEFAGRDSPVSWLMPSIFRAEQYGLDTKLLELFGYSPKLVGTVKAKDNLLWAARYGEFSRRDNVENKEEMKQLANYRFTKALQELRKVGLEETVNTFSRYFEGKLNELTQEQMRYCDEELNPMQVSTSIIKTTPESEVVKIKEAYAERKKRKRLPYLVTAVAVAVSLLAAIVPIGMSKYQKHQKAKYKAKIEAYDLVGWHKFDNITQRQVINSEKYKQALKRYGKSILAAVAYLDEEWLKRAIERAGGPSAKYCDITVNLPSSLYAKACSLSTGIDNWARRAYPGARCWDDVERYTALKRAEERLKQIEQEGIKVK